MLSSAYAFTKFKIWWRENLSRFLAEPDKFCQPSAYGLVRLWRHFRPYVRTQHYGKIQLCEAALRPAFVSREVASPTAFKRNKKKIWRQQNIKSIYVTNSRRNSKTTSGRRNKSTGTSVRILKWNHFTPIRRNRKRRIFPLEAKRFAHVTL